MQKIPVITIPFYNFVCPDNLLEEINSIVNSIKFKNNTINERSLDTFTHTSAINWINTCLEELKKELWGEKTTFNLEVVDCWINKSHRTKKHHKHLHPNSMFSGILYLTHHEKSSETVFYLDDPWRRLENERILMLTSDNNFQIFQTEHYFKPVVGNMIVFPSNFWHDTRPNIDKFPRLTLSFNSHLTGKIGNPTMSTGLNLNSSLVYE